MRKFTIAVSILAAITSSALLAKEGAVKMTKTELLAFLPGTESKYETKAGSLQHWKNEPDGNFIATTNNKKLGSALGVVSVTASGTWWVNDEGKYCITIDWRREPANWCSFVFKSADGEYFLGGSETARKIEFVK
jgi:hypothetical protein